MEEKTEIQEKTILNNYLIFLLSDNARYGGFYKPLNLTLILKE